jgi:hypothetical protein
VRARPRRLGRWLARLAGLALLAGVGLLTVRLGLIPGVGGRYRASVPALAVAYRARETCACLFVDGRDEAACLALTRASPNVARLEVDRPGAAVTARALLFWTARARWVSRRDGCVVE